jgi:leucyl/phenylalanyl-tRNA--protein transferase
MHPDKIVFLDRVIKEMSVFYLDDELWFPAQDEARDDGLLAVGGDLRPERLLLAYYNGIFPWYNDDEIPMWWSPDPRFILLPDELKVSKSMKQIIKKAHFQFRMDTAFDAVINNCSSIRRRDDPGTWISNDIVDAYTALHKLGFAHSAEAWRGDELVGGLYGIKLGNVFFGESMFSKESNASKFAFISMVEQLKAQGVLLIDCQVHTEHLESLGAKMMPRAQFLALLEAYI